MGIRGREPDKKKPPEMSYGEALIASLRKTLADSEAEEQDTLPAMLPTPQQPTSKSAFSHFNIRRGPKKHYNQWSRLILRRKTKYKSIILTPDFLNDDSQNKKNKMEHDLNFMKILCLITIQRGIIFFILPIA